MEIEDIEKPLVTSKVIEGINNEIANQILKYRRINVRSGTGIVCNLLNLEM